MATVSNQTVNTGNRIYVMAKNHLIARAQSLTANRSYGTEGVYEIGSIMPREHVYLKYTGSLTLERFRMVRDNLASQTMDIAKLGEDILPYLEGPDERGKFRVGLKEINALLIRKTGVLGAHIDISTDCTLCKPEKYWSHRYTKGERGSQAALIALL